MRRQVVLITVSSLMFVLLQACSDSSISNNPWQTPVTLKSSANISSSQATSNENGDFVIVWQEQEEKQVVDQVLTDAHDPSIPYLETDPISPERKVPSRDENGEPIVTGGILQTVPYDSSNIVHRAYFKDIDYASHETHTHVDVYQRTNVLARAYDAAAGVWRAEFPLQTGYWSKIQAGEKYTDDNGDEQFRVTGNAGQAFDTQTAVATRTNGDAIAAWIQWDEAEVAEDAGTTYAINVAHYTAASNSWRVADNLTVSQGLVLADLGLSLDETGNAQLLWLARNTTSLITNVYARSYDGTTWGMEQLLSDGNTSAHSIQIKMFNADSGVAVWAQENPNALSVYQGTDTSPCIATPSLCDSTQVNLFAQWFDGAGWKSDSPALVSNGLGLVGEYKLASNGRGVVWLIWEQTPMYLKNNHAVVGDVAQIWVSQFDVVATIPAWNTAVRLQTDDATTRLDESEQYAGQPDLAIDSAGNVMAVWVQKVEYDLLDDETTNTKWNNGIRQAIWVNTFSDGAWSAAKLLNSDERFSNERPKVVATTTTQVFTAVWLRWSSLNQPLGYKLMSVDYSALSNSAASVFDVNENADEIKAFYLALNKANQVQIIWTGDASALRYNVK